ncbi:MAG: PepSY-associated TM helix domain-containing protein [Pseudomonadota bacterium]
MGRSIWPKASSRRVGRSLEAHAVLALSVSVLIYILIVTGTLSVFNREFQRWEQPDAPEMATISAEAAERAALLVFHNEAEPSTHLYINFPQPDLPRTVITTDTQAFYARADGTVGGPERFPWTQFLLDLHYYLHLPHILGLTVVGAMGVFLVGLSLSGLLAHPRIFRDAFTFRRGDDRVSLADLHNRLSVWTAPFHISNALTGAMLGLATVLAIALAAARYDGDLEAVYTPVFGEEPALEGQAGDPAIAQSIRDLSVRHPDLRMTYAIMHDPGTDGQHVQLIGAHTDRLIFGDYYVYDAKGNFQGNTGISDGSIGQQIAGSVYNVHFGNWGGTPIKIAYGLFGLILCTITCSGLSMYFKKREEKGRPAPRLAGGWEGVVWGVPAMLSLTLAFAVSGGEGPALVAAFWLGLIGVAGAGGWIGKERIRFYGIGSTVFGLTAAVVAHTMRYPDELGSAAVLPVSLFLIVVAALLGVVLFKVEQDGKGPAEPASPALKQAE